MKAPLITMNNGRTMPCLGLGTWQLKEETCQTVLLPTIRAGLRHIDDASLYENEVFVGRAIKQAISEGVCSREELFVTTKLRPSQAHPGNISTAFNKSLTDLGLDYVDLLLIHWPMVNSMEQKSVPCPVELRMGYNEEHFAAVWAEMEALVDSGVVKSIGISNFSKKKTEALLKTARIPPVCNQIELHPVFAQNELVAYLKSKNIIPTAYAPLGCPYFTKEDPSLPDALSNETVKEIAAKHNKSVGQVLIRWAIQRGTVPIPRSSHPERAIENFTVFDFNLSEEEMNIINGLDVHHRYFKGDNFLPEGQTLHDLWDEGER